MLDLGPPANGGHLGGPPGDLLNAGLLNAGLLNGNLLNAAIDARLPDLAELRMYIAGYAARSAVRRSVAVLRRLRSGARAASPPALSAPIGPYAASFSASVATATGPAGTPLMRAS